MHLSSSISLGLWALGSMAAASNKLDAHAAHARAVQALVSDGSLGMQDESAAQVWFKASGLAPEHLPRIQEDVSLYTHDRGESLKAIADLGAAAAKAGAWGDVVYLFNVFSMNAHAEHAKVTSPQMRELLLAAVTKADGSGVDPVLIKRYAKTSSSPALAEAFKALGTNTVTLISRDVQPTCEKDFQVDMADCQTLMAQIEDKNSHPAYSEINCYKTCCMSFFGRPRPAFRKIHLLPAYYSCVDHCGDGGQMSCKVHQDLPGNPVTAVCFGMRSQCERLSL
ncbi:hypothetical protein C2857_003782 [Epichloe festucae Fl1]|uniref:WD-like domain-containing protein n=1 Tax=Epichloe festucae (strain Fl1) TaxID=877507 RepID=A0A7U3SMW5_EPIFF|nr:hypothetical protein C2857_003782 [Epichloe festucae Fl1]